MKKKLYIILGATVIIIMGLCIFNASRNSQDLKIKTKTIASEKIDGDIENLTIGFFSDLYIGENCTIDRARKLTDLMLDFNPDILLFSGDLFEDNSILSEQENELIELLSSICPKYGKYAVLGDSDLRNENTRQLSSRILEESNFEIITNSSKTVCIDNDSFLNIVGIDSAVLGTPDYDSAFLNAKEGAYTFVIAHCPDTFKMISSYDFDYCLSGHSLGGKVYIPLISFLASDTGYKNFIHGTTKSNSKTLYITNGVGTPGSNYRLNADPEIVFFTLKGK